MKWKEMTTTQRVVHCIGLFCGIFYLVIGFLNIFDVLDFPKSVLYPIWATFWLCMGNLQKIRKYAIMFYTFGVVYFLLGILNLF